MSDSDENNINLDNSEDNDIIVDNSNLYQPNSWNDCSELIKIYLLPLISLLLFIFLSLPTIDQWIALEIPNYIERVIFKGLIFVLIIYILNIGQFGFWYDRFSIGNTNENNTNENNTNENNTQ